MRTKRRYAHELYPHAEEYETRPLEVEVPYLYAMAIGHETHDTDWHDLGEPGADKNAIRLRVARTMRLIDARYRALLADALLQGMTGQQAWDWVDERGWEYEGSFVYERAEHYGVPCERIKPYPVVAEPDHHDHWSEPDARGQRTLVETVKCKESECADCCEPEDGEKP